MRNRRLLISAGMVLALTACEPAREEPPARPPAPVSETVFAPTVDSLDRARSVEGALQQGRDQADAAVEAAQ